MAQEHRRAYREFLRSSFWKELSAAKKDGVGKCERCGITEGLEAHHLVYRRDWYETHLEDLEVLCSDCHSKAHGKRTVPWLRHREDEKWNRTLYWISSLREFADRRGIYRRREYRLMVLAWKFFPPTETDSCIAYHIRRVLAYQDDNIGHPPGL